MKFNKFLMFSLLFNLHFVAQADPVRETVTCADDHYLFVMKDSAIPTFRTAVLAFSGREISLQCRGKFQSDATTFTCEEKRAGGGRYFIQVLLSEEVKTAEVFHEQFYPLPLKKLSQLDCEISS